MSLTTPAARAGILRIRIPRAGDRASTALSKSQRESPQLWFEDRTHSRSDTRTYTGHNQRVPEEFSQ